MAVGGGISTGCPAIGSGNVVSGALAGRGAVAVEDGVEIGLIAAVKGDAGGCRRCQFNVTSGKGVGAAGATGNGELGDVDVVACAGVGGQAAAAEGKNTGGIVVGGGAEAWSGDIGDGDGIAGAVGW